MILTYRGRIVDTNGKPVPGLPGVLRRYSLKAPDGEPISEFVTTDEGMLGGKEQIDDSAFENGLPFVGLTAEDLRLFAGAPGIAFIANRKTVTLSFGDVISSVADRGEGPVLQHVGIDQVVTGLGTKLRDAGKTLDQAEQGGLRLGNIKVQLRGVVGDDGLGIALNDPTATAEAGSVVEVEYEQSNEADVAPTRTVPSVVGATATLARRILASVGLQMIASSSTAGEGEVVGQCVMQSPKAGSEVAAGTEVMVVFASPNGNESEE